MPLRKWAKPCGEKVKRGECAVAVIADIPYNISHGPLSARQRKVKRGECVVAVIAVNPYNISHGPLSARQQKVKRGECAVAVISANPYNISHGPLSARQRNAMIMAFRRWADFTGVLDQTA